MKKVGIVTINDLNNYGNRLQCYAVQEILKKNDIKNENIYNPKYAFKHELKRYIKILLRKKNQILLEKRRKYFKKFNKNIDFSKYRVKKFGKNKKINNSYSNFLVGSDQVWNPYFAAKDIYFLKFTSNEKKNALSASIGVGNLPKEQKERFKKELMTFRNISVREDAGKGIIKELTNREDIEVLVDPTMLLSANEWDKVSKKPKQLKNEKYILNYFLGKLPNSWKEQIDEIAQKNGCKVINVLDRNDPFYLTGPSEFLYLEKNAFLVCTDSFHSSVFSIIYDTPFIVFERVEKSDNIKMNSRMDTLLSKFNLQNRKFNEVITEDLLKCDYSEAKQILEQEKNKSLEFIRKIIE